MYPKLELYLSLYNGYEGESKELLQSMINQEVWENKDEVWFKEQYGDFDGVGWGVSDFVDISFNGGKREKKRRSKKKNLPKKKEVVKEKSQKRKKKVKVKVKEKNKYNLI